MHKYMLLAFLAAGVSLLATPAGAAGWRHEVQVEDSVRFLEKRLNASAAEGFRVSVVVNDVSHRAVLLSRHESGELGRFGYRILEGISQKELDEAGAAGFTWRGGATVRGQRLIYLVLERDSKDAAPVELRALAASGPETTRRDLGPLLADGFTIVAYFARPSLPGAELLLARRGKPPARELDLVTGANAIVTSRNLAASAKAGYTLEAFWTRSFSDRGGPPDWAFGVLGRPKGSGGPAPTLRATMGEDPSRAGERLVGLAPFQESGSAPGTLYAYTPGDVRYDDCEAPAAGLLGGAREVMSALEGALRACESHEIVATWIVTGEGGKPVFHLVTRR